MKRLFAFMILLLIMLAASAQLPQHDSFRVLHNNYYQTIYSDCLRVPCCSKYYFIEQVSQKKLKRQLFRFKQDKRVAKPRPKDSDYTNSGYVRGHLVPSADMAFSMNAMKATFIMSNVAPMKQDFNNGVWKQIENKARTMGTIQSGIVILTGVAAEPNAPKIRIKGNIWVPDGFWKVIYDSHSKSVLLAWLILHSRNITTEKDSRCPIDSIIKYAYLWPYREELETTTH